MRFMLDTNAAIALIGRKSPALLHRVLATRKGGIGISSIVAHELFFGAYGSQRVAFNLESLRLFLRDFGQVPFDEEDAREAGEIRASLKTRGSPIGPYDLLIAAQAKRRGLVVVTNNRREFERVDGLQIEDWLTP